MLYRAARWKLEHQDIQSFKQGLVSRSRRRTFTERPVKMVIPVPIVDQREVAFRHFTKIGSIDRKTKNRPGYHLKNQKRNNFLAWLANDSCATVVSRCNSTGVSASTIYTAPSRLSVVSNGNVSMDQRMKILETAGDLEMQCSPSENSFPPISEMIVEDYDSEMIRPRTPRKSLIKKADFVDLIVAMFKVLSLDDKRKIKESDKEHFETFRAHRLHARPYLKRMKAY